MCCHAMSCMSCHVNNVFYPAVAASSCQMFKFDTTAAPLEALSAELGVKALPAFKFYRGGKEAETQVLGYKKAPLEEAVRKLAGK